MGDEFTPRELYALFQSINERLTRIETRIESLMGLQSQFGDLEDRVRELEGARAMLVGIGAAISLAISLLVSYLHGRLP